MDAESRCIYTLLDARMYVGGLFVAWTELIQGVVGYCDWKVGDGDNEAGAEGGGDGSAPTSVCNEAWLLSVNEEYERWYPKGGIEAERGWSVLVFIRCVFIICAEEWLLAAGKRLSGELSNSLGEYGGSDSRGSWM